MAALAGCAHFHPTQSPDKVLVRAGPIDEFRDAAPFADAFVTYALIADQTYADGAYASKHYLLGARTYCYPYGKPDCLDVTPHARALLDKWRIVYAHMDAKAFACTPGRVPCT
jgi:hypothetical protein